MCVMETQLLYHWKLTTRSWGIPTINKTKTSPAEKTRKGQCDGRLKLKVHILSGEKGEKCFWQV